VAAWNNLAASYLTIYHTTNDENDTDHGDLENEVAWDDTMSGSTLGLAWTFALWGELYESDITFNPYPSTGAPWVSGAPPPSAWHYNWYNMVAFRPVALHELGHAQGLGHYNYEAAIMNSYYPFGGWYRGQNTAGFNSYYGRHLPHTDDVQGAQAIYSNTAVGRDLTILRAKTGYTSGGAVNGSAVDLAPVKPNGRTDITTICPGGYLDIEYTVENRGNEIVTPMVWAYLSTNLWITPSDIPVNGKAHALAPYEAEFVQHRFYMPSSIPAGTYYVGVFVDPDNDITGEQSEDYNNGVDLYVGTSPNQLLTVLPSGGSCP